MKNVDWSTLKARAKQMRQEPTAAEAHLWAALRGRKMRVRFRRQHPIGPFIVDFYCRSARLVIEADGLIHRGLEAWDAQRQSWLEAQGLTVIRFTNEDIINNTPAVLTHIQQHL